MFRSPVTRPLHPSNWVRPAGNSDFRVTSPFGPRSDGFHGGLDIGNFRAGDDVVAIGPAIVEAAGNLTHPWSTATQRFPTGNYGGLMVVLKHPGGTVSIYAHLMNRAVTVGQSVTAGHRLGAVGDSGSAQGAAHLHFGIQSPTPIQGVASQKTDLGIGLDVDPWPLITGQIPDTSLPAEDDDVNLKGRFVSHVSNRKTVLTVPAHFRAGVEEGDDLSLKVFPAGTAFFPVVAVKGRSVGGSDDWLGGWLYVERWTFGYFHASVLAQGEPIERSGYTADDLELAKTEGRKAGQVDMKTRLTVKVQGEPIL